MADPAQRQIRRLRLRTAALFVAPLLPMIFFGKPMIALTVGVIAVYGFALGVAHVVQRLRFVPRVLFLDFAAMRGRMGADSILRPCENCGRPSIYVITEDETFCAVHFIDIHGDQVAIGSCRKQLPTEPPAPAPEQLH